MRRQPLATGAAEALDGSLRFSGFEQDACKPDRRPARDEAVVEVARELDCLLCGGERGGEIADYDCDDGAVEEVPGESRRGRAGAASIQRRPSSVASARLPPTYQILGGIGYRRNRGSPRPVARTNPRGTTRVRVGLGVEVE